MTDIKINTIPSPTWHFLKINDTAVKWDTPITAAAVNSANADEAFTAPENTPLFHSDLDILSDTIDHAPISVSSNQGEEKTARITVDDLGGSSAAIIAVNAAADSRITLYLTVKGSGHLLLSVRANIQKNAQATIILTQLTEKDGKLLADIYTAVKDSGTLKLHSLFPGTNGTFVRCESLLEGDESRLDSVVAYLGEKNELLDMNYIAAHQGRQTECSIKVDGALSDNAAKTFRGTIDFRKGSSGSRGSETENVLLLGDDVENKTLPVILCGEEDVNGTHGAAIGDLSDEMLFYFASRGISKQQAESIMKASIADSFCRFINDEDTTQAIRERVGYEYE